MTDRIWLAVGIRRLLLAFAFGLALPCCWSSDRNSPAFSQADLTGSWDLVQISTNGVPGWYVASITVAPDGQIAITSNADSNGNTTLPPAGFDVRLTVDATGKVALAGANGSPAFRGTLSSSKTLIVATDTESTPPLASYSLSVARKRLPGVTFSPSDVTSFPFALHALRVGSSPGWQVGAGSTDALRQITVTSLLDSSGGTATPPANFDTIQIDSNGLVTTANDASFHGLMTSDKNAIFAVSTNDPTLPGTYQLLAILRTGQTFAAADLAGVYGVDALTSAASGAGSSWFQATVTIDVSGEVTFTSYLTSWGGGTAPTGVVFAFDTATGIITRSVDPTFHGRLAFGKDFYVRTSGSATLPSLAVALK